MSAKHTPGPWRVMNHPRVMHVDSDVSVGSGANGMASVAWITGGKPRTNEDARLLAAAPDLLAALERLLYRPEAHGQICKTDPCPECEARAAIRKARGDE